MFSPICIIIIHILFIYFHNYVIIISYKNIEKNRINRSDLIQKIWFIRFFGKNHDLLDFFEENHDLFQPWQ